MPSIALEGFATLFNFILYGIIAIQASNSLSLIYYMTPYSSSSKYIQ